jgi:diketogulonate reductase-like aldo/keto reductase
MIGTVRFRQNAYFTISRFARQPWLRLRGREPITDSVRLQKRALTPALLRCVLQQGNIAPVPRYSNPERIAQNLDVFDFTLTADEKKRI